jgi:hypothetical protein
VAGSFVGMAASGRWLSGWFGHDSSRVCFN